MFRFLSSLFVALAALFALRLFFAAARHANKRGEPRRPVFRGSDVRERVAKSSSAPRIDPALAEDVPFVEVEREREREKVR
ncbi:MAG: hypothetical protein AAB011_08580 [Candidatus Eisenbacteria bacterium]